MFYLVMETWPPGRATHEPPAQAEVVFGSSFYEAVAHLAHEQVKRFELSGRDPVRQTWWARARDHHLRFRITTQAKLPDGLQGIQGAE